MLSESNFLELQFHMFFITIKSVFLFVFVFSMLRKDYFVQVSGSKKIISDLI